MMNFANRLGRASAAQSTAKRVISGLNTHTQHASDVYIDQPTGDIYVINNDTVHNTTIYGTSVSGASTTAATWPPSGRLPVQRVCSGSQEV